MQDGDVSEWGTEWNETGKSRHTGSPLHEESSDSEDIEADVLTALSWKIY
jgi:hypothetical protein